MSENNIQKLHIGLSENSYDIFIGDALLETAGKRLKDFFPTARFGIITDSNVAKAQLPRLTKSLDEAGLSYSVIEVKAGEASKCLSTLEYVVDEILAAKLERNDIILALGGGVIGDLAGFAASIARRGMDFVQLPTSLLAQVDSSVGGKTGINSKYGKNLIGAFHQPKMVIADLDALKTLSKRQFTAGYAEMVKYGLIDDEDFFFWLEENYQEIFAHGAALAKAIANACKAKARFVIADEKEAGVRALLNLGHTFSHALEKVTGYSDRLYHGEGVSIGMVLAHEFSAKLNLANSQDGIRVKRHLQLAGLPTMLSDIEGERFFIDDLMDAITQDKKVKRGALTFILTKGIGKSFIEHNVDKKQVISFLKEKLDS